METNSNTVLYTPRKTRRVKTTIASGTALNTYTKIADADATYGSLVTNIMCRTADAANRVWDIIICPTGAEATAANAEAAVTIPANSGNNGTVALASIASLAPDLFDIDLAGNRVISLEAGWSIYARNAAATAGLNYFNVKIRDYNP